jgi:hypothetical protein
MDEAQPLRLSDLNRDWLDRLCKEAGAAGNPLLFYRALSVALRAAFERAIEDAEAEGHPEPVRAAFDADHHVRLPADLHYFLRNALWRLCELEEGRDFREYPSGGDAKRGSREYEAYLEERRAYLNRSRHGEMRLAPDAAAKLVPQALWITRPGFNAFMLSERRNWAAVAEAEEAAARERGASPLQARFEAMERLGYSDDRSFRRLKSRKRRGRGKPPT